MTQKEYEKLPGYGAAEILNGLGGNGKNQICCKFAKTKNKKDAQYLVEFFIENNRLMSKVKPFLPEP